MARTLLLTILLALCSLPILAPTAAIQDAERDPAGDQEREEQRDYVVAWVGVGSGADASRRGVGWPGILKPDGGGWPEFIERVIEPIAADMRAAGFRPRIVLHNPFGVPAPGARMQFDQAIHARYRGEHHPPMPWLVNGFREAWEPWLDANPDVEVIGYLGAIPGDPDLEPGTADPDKIQWRTWEATRAVIGSGMNLALDAVSGAPADSVAATYARFARASGVPIVYVEARPTQEHWAGWPFICEARYFRRSDPERHPDAAALGNLPNGRLGRGMILIGWHDPEQRLSLAIEHAAEGRDVALAVSRDELRAIMAALAKFPSRERAGRRGT